jgi:hypothetical protein
MKKTNIYIGLGVLALVGVYFYMQRKKSDAVESTSETKPTDVAELGKPATSPYIPPSSNVSKEMKMPKTNTAQAYATPDTYQESILNSNESAIALSKKDIRKQGRSDKKTFKADCGRRPSLARNRPAWQKCVDGQKLAEGSSFEGTKSMDIFSDISGGFENMDIL